MSHDTIGAATVAAGSGVITTEAPTPELRWVERVRGMKFESVLQQQWIINQYQTNRPIGRSMEWRDVPTETEA